MIGHKSVASSVDVLHIRPVLDFILGTEVLGLLDSGASRTIFGNSGYKLLQELGLKLSSTVKSE